MSSCGTKPTRLSLRKSVRVLLFTLTVPVASPSAPRPGTAVSQTQLRATPAYIYTSRVSPPPVQVQGWGAARWRTWCILEQSVLVGVRVIGLGLGSGFGFRSGLGSESE